MPAVRLAGQLAVQAVRAGRVLAEAGHTVLLIGLEVAFEPVPFGRVLVIALPCEDMRGDSVILYLYLNGD